MAYWITDTTGLPNGKSQTSFGCDTEADVATLPPLSDQVAPGSSVFILEGQTLKYLKSDGSWV
jgi:hypothetical protein